MTTTPTTQAAKRSFDYFRNATFVSLLLGYAGYYLYRQNLSAAYAPLNIELGIDKVQFGWITSLGTLMYALGKVMTGSIADSKLGGRRIFFVGLFGSVIASFIFGIGSGFLFFVIAWGTNRFFQSMGWGGLVNVMARWFPQKSYGTAMGLMSISYQFGGVLASLYAGFILSVTSGGWQPLFIIPAITLAVIGVVSSRFLVNSPEDVGFSSPANESSTSQTAADEDLTYWQRFAILLKDRAFLLMLGLSFLLTFLRECFNVWMPAYFSELGATASAAAFKSAIFPLLGCAGTLFAGWFSDRYLSGRRGPVMAVLMIGLVLSLLCLGRLDAIVAAASSMGGAWFDRSNVALILVGMIGFFLLGPYSLVGGVVAMDFGGRRTSGTAAGLLDGAGYLAATLSGVGLANVLVQSGWEAAYRWMAIVTVFAIILCGLLWQVKPRVHA